MIEQLLDEALDFMRKGQSYAAISRIAQIEKLASLSSRPGEQAYIAKSSQVLFDANTLESVSVRLGEEFRKLRHLIDHPANLVIEEVIHILSIRLEIALVRSYLQRYGKGSSIGQSDFDAIDQDLAHISSSPKDRQKFLKAGRMLENATELPASVHSPFLELMGPGN